MSASEVEAYAGFGPTRVVALDALCSAMLRDGRVEVRPTTVRHLALREHFEHRHEPPWHRFEVDTVPDPLQ